MEKITLDNLNQLILGQTNTVTFYPRSGPPEDSFVGANDRNMITYSYKYLEDKVHQLRVQEIGFMREGGVVIQTKRLNDNEITNGYWWFEPVNMNSFFQHPDTIV